MVHSIETFLHLAPGCNYCLWPYASSCHQQKYCKLAHVFCGYYYRCLLHSFLSNQQPGQLDSVVHNQCYWSSLQHYLLCCWPGSMHNLLCCPLLRSSQVQYAAHPVLANLHAHFHAMTWAALVVYDLLVRWMWSCKDGRHNTLQCKHLIGSENLSGNSWVLLCGFLLCIDSKHCRLMQWRLFLLSLK